jgi:hypothetical protein
MMVKPRMSTATIKKLTLAFVVIPAVIHESDAAIDGRVHQPDALIFGESVLSDMKTTHADDGNALSGATESAVEHVTASCSRRRE